MRRFADSKRIAVVGAGVSGLVAAAELHRTGDDIHVFEAAGYPGGHTNTIDVETLAGPLPLDTGFITFNELNYPNFERMLGELGVASQAADMSFSVSDGRAASSGRRPAARPVREASARARPALSPHAARPRPLQSRGPQAGRQRRPWPIALPIPGRRWLLGVLRGAAAGAAGLGGLVRRPRADVELSAGFFAEFFENHRVLQLRGRPGWRSVTGGSRRYVEALIAPFRDRVHLRARVRRIHRLPRGVVVALDDSCERFDEVVMAVHSDVALGLIADPSPAEAEVLGAIPYRQNTAVLHTDTRLMPQRRSAWASWNYHLSDRPTGRTTVTYYMNRLQSLVAGRDYLVTLNLSEAIDPAAIIRRIDYATRSSSPRASTPSGAGPRSPARGGRTTAAPTGAGASTRTASGRRSGCPRGSAAAVHCRRSPRWYR